MLPLVYFVRHGQTDWNAEGRLQGQADTDINQRGREQADRNGQVLARLIARPEEFDFVASPMRRTRETMERLRLTMGLDPFAFRTDERLIEIHFGAWQGLTFVELEAREPGSTKVRRRDKWNFRPPGPLGESYEMLRARVTPWLESLAQPTVCVTHGGVIRAVFRVIGQMSERDAAALNVPQDRVLRLQDGLLDWL
ncbi:MAG: histidine phosphatase family protein [Mesorhizobium sp.]